MIPSKKQIRNSGSGVVEVKEKDFIIMHDLQLEKSILKTYFQHISFIATKSPVFHSANIYWYLPCAKHCAQIWKDTKMSMIESLSCRNSPFNNGSNNYRM